MENALIESKAIKLAIVTAIIGMFTKFGIGIISGSMSMISSAIDSLGDLMVSIINLFIVKTSNKEADDDHNFGHTKVEGFGAIFEGGFIFAAGIFIIYESIHNLLLKNIVENNMIGLITMIFVMIMTFFIVRYLKSSAEKTGSLVLKSDALHYQTDLYVNIGVFLSLLLVRLTGLYAIDSIVSIMIALYMMYSSRVIIIEGFDILMDKAICIEDQQNLKKILDKHQGKNIVSYHDLKTRKGKIAHVEVHIVVEGHTSVNKLHLSMKEIIKSIRNELGHKTRVYIYPDFIEDGKTVHVYE